LPSFTLHPKWKTIAADAMTCSHFWVDWLCWWKIVSDLQFSFMWGHTNLFVPIPSIVMWPSILIHVRSHKPFCDHMVNCYVTFKSHWGQTLSRHIHK
jgi:hypothetical protein